ncbi:MAG TPA: hypothetical protein VF446_12170 [Trinickia sp.]
MLRINLGLRRAASQTDSDITLAELAQRNFIVVTRHEIAFRVISRLWKQHGAMAVVAEQDDPQSPVRVLGVIAKEHVADSVARSIRIFPGKH